MNQDIPLKWKELETTVVFKNPFLTLHKDRCEHPSLGEHNFYVFDFRDWVNIVPVTTDGQMVLVKQYRRGTDSITLEIPAGSLDPGETDPVAGALRELREETGYEPAEMRLLARAAVNPAIQNNYCYLYLATGCELKHPISPDSTEELLVELVPLTEIRDKIYSGEIVHSLAMLGIMLALDNL